MARKPSSLEIFNTLLGELKSPDVKPVYALFGDESFFHDRLQEAAIALIPEESRDFNLDVLYGQDIKVDKMIDICRSYPMMADRRTVVVRDFMMMFDKEQHIEEEDEQKSGSDKLPGLPSAGYDDLIAYLQQPNPTTLLVLINAKKPAGKLGKAFKNSPTQTAHTFEPVPDYRLQQWITEWASLKHDLQFDDNAAQLLGFHVGSDLQKLTVEIEKLKNYREGKGPVRVQDVQEAVGLTRDFTLFDFSDALLDRQKEKAITVARHIVNNADYQAGEVIKIIGFLYATFGKIWHIQRLSRKGLTPGQIKDNTGIKNKFYFDKLMKSSKNFPLGSCPLLFEALLDADKAIKGFGNETPEAILLMTVKKILD